MLGTSKISSKREFWPKSFQFFTQFDRREPLDFNIYNRICFFIYLVDRICKSRPKNSEAQEIKCLLPYLSFFTILPLNIVWFDVRRHIILRKILHLVGKACCTQFTFWILQSFFFFVTILFILISLVAGRLEASSVCRLQSLLLTFIICFPLKKMQDQRWHSRIKIRQCVHYYSTTYLNRI